jgi:hypothetical protein
VRKTVFALVVFLIAANLASAEEDSFSRVKVPDAKGNQAKAVLTFSDQHKALEVHPAKRGAVSIPYGAIDSCSYEITRKHRVSADSIITAPIGIGLVVMMTRTTSHWLEIHYHEGIPKVFVLRMDKREYLRILDAFKAHTGIDVAVLGNVYQRR